MIEKSINSLRKYLSQRKDASSAKVKISAIAKNEAAYLPEWIYHHLYFGADEIDIFINRTTDNSLQLRQLMADLPVNFIDADEIFLNLKENPQTACYKLSLTNAYQRNVSHVLLIDIDEFWFPIDMTTKMGTYATNYWAADVINFEWVNKLEDSKEFTPAIAENLSIDRGPQVKSMMRSYVRPKKFNAHNVADENYTNVLANGDSFIAVNEARSRVNDLELKKPVKSAAILHRKYRSQKEYIAMLSRGVPTVKGLSHGPFKLNRKGFNLAPRPEKLNLPAEPLHGYQEYMHARLHTPQIQSFLTKAHQFVDQQFFDVLDLIRKADCSEAENIERALTNITHYQVEEAHRMFLSRVNNQ